MPVEKWMPGLRVLGCGGLAPTLRLLAGTGWRDVQVGGLAPTLASVKNEI